MTFYLTFGVQYRREPHPAGAIAHPGGWVEIEANSEMEARSIAVEHFGQAWAFLYAADRFDASYHPLGCLARFTANGETMRR